MDNFVFVFVLVSHVSILVDTVDIDAVPFSLPLPPSLSGPLMSNSVLYEAERLHEEKINTPQSYVSLGDGLYTVTSDSLVLNVAPCRPLVVANLKPRACRHPQTCGQLTSIRRSAHNKLLVVDAYRGVFEVDPVTGVTIQIYNSKRFVNGRPSKYLNDVIVLPDGTMILSDVSAHFTLAEEFWIRFEGRADGRLIGFNPLNRVAKEIVAGLAYPNGLELTYDGQAFLVAETGRARILRVELSTRQLLTRTFFAENLPGMPEHIRQSGRGTYWVGLSYARFQGSSSAMDQYALQPASRNILAKHTSLAQLKLMFNPRGIAVELDTRGDVIGSLHDSTGLKVSQMTEVTENAGVVYVGSRQQNAVIRAVLADVANVHITVSATLQVLRSRCQITEQQVPLARQRLREQFQADKKAEAAKEGQDTSNSLVPKTDASEYASKALDTQPNKALDTQPNKALDTQPSKALDIQPSDKAPMAKSISTQHANAMVGFAHIALPQTNNRVATSKPEAQRQQPQQRQQQQPQQQQQQQQAQRQPQGQPQRQPQGLPQQAPERSREQFHRDLQRIRLLHQQSRQRLQQQARGGVPQNSATSALQQKAVPPSGVQNRPQTQTNAQTRTQVSGKTSPSENQQPNQQQQQQPHQQPQRANAQQGPPPSQRPQVPRRPSPSMTTNRRLPSVAAQPTVKAAPYHPQLTRDSFPRSIPFQLPPRRMPTKKFTLPRPKLPQHQPRKVGPQSVHQASSQRYQSSVNFHPAVPPGNADVQRSSEPGHQNVSAQSLDSTQNQNETANEPQNGHQQSPQQTNPNEAIGQNGQGLQPQTAHGTQTDIAHGSQNMKISPSAQESDPHDVNAADNQSTQGQEPQNGHDLGQTTQTEHGNNYLITNAQNLQNTQSQDLPVQNTSSQNAQNQNAHTLETHNQYPLDQSQSNYDHVQAYQNANDQVHQNPQVHNPQRPPVPTLSSITSQQPQTTVNGNVDPVDPMHNPQEAYQVQGYSITNSGSIPQSLPQPPNENVQIDQRQGFVPRQTGVHSDSPQFNYFAGVQSQDSAPRTPQQQQQQHPQHLERDHLPPTSSLAGFSGFTGRQLSLPSPQMNNGQDTIIAGSLFAQNSDGEPTRAISPSSFTDFVDNGTPLDASRSSGLSTVNNQMTSDPTGPNSQPSPSPANSFDGISFQREALQPASPKTGSQTDISEANHGVDRFDRGMNAPTSAVRNEPSTTGGTEFQQSMPQRSMSSHSLGGFQMTHETQHRPTSTGGQSMSQGMPMNPTDLNSNGPGSPYGAGLVTIPNGHANDAGQLGGNDNNNNLDIGQKQLNIPGSPHGTFPSQQISIDVKTQQTSNAALGSNPVGSGQDSVVVQTPYGEQTSVGYPTVHGNVHSRNASTNINQASVSSWPIAGDNPSSRNEEPIISYADGFYGLIHQNQAASEGAPGSRSNNAGDDQGHDGNTQHNGHAKGPNGEASDASPLNTAPVASSNPVQRAQQQHSVASLSDSTDIRTLQMFHPGEGTPTSNTQSVNQKPPAHQSKSGPNKVALNQGLQQLRRYLQRSRSVAGTGNAGTKPSSTIVQSNKSPSAAAPSSRNLGGAKSSDKTQTTNDLAAVLNQSQGKAVAGFLEIKQDNGQTIRVALSQDIIRQALGQMQISEGQNEATSNANAGVATRKQYPAIIVPKPQTPSRPAPTHHQPNQTPPRNVPHSRTTPNNPPQHAGEVRSRIPSGGNQWQQYNNNEPGQGPAAFQDPRYQRFRQQQQPMQLPHISRDFAQRRGPMPFTPQDIPMSPSLSSLPPQFSPQYPSNSPSQNPSPFPQQSGRQPYQQLHNQPPVWLPLPTPAKSPFIPQAPGSDPSFHDPWQPEIQTGFPPVPRPSPQSQPSSFASVYRQSPPFPPSQRDLGMYTNRHQAPPLPPQTPW